MLLAQLLAPRRLNRRSGEARRPQGPRSGALIWPETLSTARLWHTRKSRNAPTGSCSPSNGRTPR